MEIEVKAYLKNKAGVVAQLEKLGCVLAPVKAQDDMVWVEQVGSYEVFMANKVFVRIRVQDGERVILTAKISKASSGNNNLIKREHEIVVDSAEEARNILQMLGLQEAVRTIKKRQTTVYGDYEICLDDVEGLGSFIEVEKIDDEAHASAAQTEIMTFLESLGVPAIDRVMKGYDMLMLEMMGNGI
jgi:adenylate cyclase class 2